VALLLPSFPARLDWPGAVMVELAVNDMREASTTSLQRRTYERLLRRILSQPSQPALALVNHYAWLLAAGDGQKQGMFYGGPESQFNELAQVRPG